MSYDIIVHWRSGCSKEVIDNAETRKEALGLIQLYAGMYGSAARDVVMEDVGEYSEYVEFKEADNSEVGFEKS